MCAQGSASLRATCSFTVGCILCDLETMSSSDRHALNYNNSHKQDVNDVPLIHCHISAPSVCYVISLAELCTYTTLALFISKSTGGQINAYEQRTQRLLPQRGTVRLQACLRNI